MKHVFINPHALSATLDENKVTYPSIDCNTCRLTSQARKNSYVNQYFPN